jgi:hypothetical protein
MFPFLKCILFELDLEEAAGRRDQYKKCGNLLEAIQQLMEYFQQYETIPKVMNSFFTVSVLRVYVHVYSPSRTRMLKC